jgi:hypothetical protein
MRLIVIGECHAERIVNRPEFKNKISPYFEIIHYSFGNGNTDCQLHRLQISEFKEDDIFLLDDNPIGWMLNDVDYVPFNINCNETAKFKQAHFSTSIKPINIIFEYLDK